MSKMLIVFFKSDGFHMGDGKSPIVGFKLDRHTKIPNVPIYHHIWENPKTCKAELFKFIKAEYSFSKLFKPKLYLIMPDDTIFVDKRCITEFLLSMGYFKEPIIINERLLLVNNPLLSYVAITESERAVCLSFIKDRKTVGTKYFDKNFNDIEEMRKEIKALTDGSGFMNVPVYLHGENISSFGELGDRISLKQMYSNFLFLQKNKSKSTSNINLAKPL